jgi:uncharacterized protein (DUF983 family)
VVRVNHGTFSGYTKGGCRCESCTAANREYQRERTERRRLNGIARGLGRLPVLGGRMPMPIGVTEDVSSKSLGMYVSSSMTFRQAVTARCSNCGATGKSNAKFGKRVERCGSCR